MLNDETKAVSFSSRIKQLIGDRSVNAFARTIGMNQAAIDRYAKGLREPNAEALRMIAAKCGVSADWLLGLSENPCAEAYTDWRKRAQRAESRLMRLQDAVRSLNRAMGRIEGK